MAKKFAYPELSVDVIAGAVMAHFPADRFTCVTNATRVHTAAAGRSMDVLVSCIGDGYPLNGFGGLTFIDCRNNRPDLLAEKRDAAKIRDVGHYFHQVAFACPEGMATAEDMDASVGLFVVNGEGVGRWLKTPTSLVPRRDIDRHFFQRTLYRLREQAADSETKTAVEEALYQRAMVAAEKKLEEKIARADRDRDWAIRERDDLRRRHREFREATGLSLENYGSDRAAEIAAVRAVKNGRVLALPDALGSALVRARQAVAELERAVGEIQVVSEMKADCVVETPAGGAV